MHWPRPREPNCIFVPKSVEGQGEAEEDWLNNHPVAPRCTGLTRWAANFSGSRFSLAAAAEVPFLTTGWSQLRYSPIRTQQQPGTSCIYIISKEILGVFKGGDTECCESRVATWHAATD